MTAAAVVGRRNRALLAWYRHHRRPLPWRGSTDPWHILVSEVMSQQTQAERVAARFDRFIRRFPTTRHLAGSTAAEVVAEWSGLGYNRRALHLLEAARRVSATGWPVTVDGLRTLPGVGPYTAAAVACFAFGAQVATVDTNMRRVLSRWHGAALNGAKLARHAADHVPSGRAEDWNQAVMDLGAAICTAQAPRCDECPVAEWCRGPATYQPPRRQGPWEGSSRQARGAVLRAVVESGPLSMDDLAAEVCLPEERLVRSVAGLERDGLLVRRGTQVCLP